MVRGSVIQQHSHSNTREGKKAHAHIRKELDRRRWCVEAREMVCVRLDVLAHAQAK